MYSKKIFDLDLNYGPHLIDYTKNGINLLLAGSKGQIALIDWQDKHLYKEFSINDKLRHALFLHDESLIGVAQKDSVRIYDKEGLQIHALKKLD